ncbi:solute carrier family 22 member 15 [Lingula anatina]|uniref:Solute carrier family 22 member 15 n=1 Tax=Lingula anatina TaxID=7574 RepID=A0A1S3JMJ5_LINAN|nr:solute carrier family 22 member 15 [Lingula anatina]|eukprot:XP_013411592.1 solute carrier family 22 member 15 [Lingula anatina]
MFISFAGDVVQLVAAEIYPTVIRHVGISFCASVSRLGAVIAPQILALRHIYKPLPFIVWGTLTIATALLPFLLPETLGLSLPQTLEAWDARLNHGSLDDADDESVDLQTKQETKDQSGEGCYRSHEEGDHLELAPINA